MTVSPATGAVEPVPVSATRTVGVLSFVRRSPAVPESLAPISDRVGAAGSVVSGVGVGVGAGVDDDDPATTASRRQSHQRQATDDHAGRNARHCGRARTRRRPVHQRLVVRQRGDRRRGLRDRGRLAAVRRVDHQRAWRRRRAIGVELGDLDRLALGQVVDDQRIADLLGRDARRRLAGRAVDDLHLATRPGADLGRLALQGGAGDRAVGLGDFEQQRHCQCPLMEGKFAGGSVMQLGRNWIIALCASR